jgi:hypothetical protein
VRLYLAMRDRGPVPIAPSPSDPAAETPEESAETSEELPATAPARGA